MPKTTSKRKRKQKPKPALVPTSEVLTLSEAAAYLRVPEEKVGQLAHEYGLPGRQIGKEWRFLKSSIDGWLKGALAPNKAAWKSVAGIWKDDPSVEEMLKEIYRQRGRPMTEDGE
jgi:excisionase family DNA binding protein